ncbi:threonylcarbamoyl-AMP synthase [bacterium]|nr:MAG: threonylcarbamoyl-AMP synthase [bacterium]RIK64377.1 MAG: threonylcarbamoyl-AMP synthase [Planctomycetota bacterium]
MHTQVGTDVEHAARLLEQGELVAIPTETVYGLAANALNAVACARIFEVKNRPGFDPLIVHLAPATDFESALSACARAVPPWASKLAGAFWPGPLTLVLPRKPLIPDIVTSGLETVALRMPAHVLAQRLLERLPFPLAAPSANPFGFVSPTTAQHVLDQLGGKIAYVLDGGPCRVGLESTIVGEQDGRPVVLRLGGLGVEDLEGVVGPLGLATSSGASPGSLESHYAPRTPLYFDDLGYRARGLSPDQVALLLFRAPLAEVPPDQQEVLSASGDLNEAARHLFGAMRRLDALAAARGLRAIFTQKFPERGLGRAINDRLRRASSRYAT